MEVGTLWLIRLLMATNDPSAPSPVSTARAISCALLKKAEHFRRNVHQRFDMVLRTYQAMSGKQRTSIQEYDAAFIFVYGFSRDFTANNFAEYAVAVYHSFPV